MKYLGRILLTLIALTGLYHITFSGDIGVSKIEVQDANTLTVTLSENQNLKQGELEAELTILGDIKIDTAVARENTANQVEIFLSEVLKGDTSYSLLTVSGAEGSIDFKTPAGVEGFKQDNIKSVENQDIKSIEAIDEKTLLLTYGKDLMTTSFEFKLLEELPIISIVKPDYDVADIILKTSSKLKSEQEYILMIIEMQDVDGNYLEFDTGIYDFTTPVIPPEDILPSEEAITGDEGSGALDIVEIQDTSALEETELNTAPEEGSMEKTSEEELAAIAALAIKTPETGAATWILILATLVINSIYYLSRRKKIKLA